MSVRRMVARMVCLVVVALSAGACSGEMVEVTRIVPREVTRVVIDTIAADGQTIEVTRLVSAESDEAASDETQEPGRQEYVTLDLTLESDIPTLDPQLASDSVSVRNIENLFVQLTNWNPVAGTMSPEAARSWEISDDGLTYTFHLRDDIPWIYHNPISGTTMPVTDAGSETRMVSAQDFVSGIRRACHPDTGAYFGALLARMIVGCEALLAGGEGDDLETLVAGVGVRAPDAETLVVQLKFPASYFISMTSLVALSAIPSWAVEEHGGEWIEAGNIVTNGRYVLHEWVHGVQSTLIRNPYLPQSLYGEGNVERVVVRIVPDMVTAYGLWLEQEVDIAVPPAVDIQSHLAHFEELTQTVSRLSVAYIGFVNNKAPFDDPRVRRAFSAAIDRETLVREVRQGQGRPMIHLAPPGIVGAPPVFEVGVGFDPGYARRQLAAAGYEGCQGFPTLSIISFPGQEALSILEFVQGQWQQHLGCPPEIIQIEQQHLNVMLTSTASNVPVQDVPHMYTMAWEAAYPDENNWVGDLLWCGIDGNRTRRACSEVDDLILEAAQVADTDRRERLYRQIEEAFFGPEGEMPIAPVTQIIYYLAVQEWVEHTPALQTNRWYDWRIDWEAKVKARGRN